ncbi:response regulator [Mangrovibrevibacter kandeliae]|uniref:response regulator n=1 Tax=Mangrovibrevibacter kandeliae TaxID=2968473 RepID=UPI002119B33B|nr:response regulator [Aurantimonas sp. CSK15Z-1]MCQ8781405.1 response regulator [Aurantimonas sp. CSK15Z-1]
MQEESKQRRQILIVEDNPGDVELVEEWLGRPSGVDVEVVHAATLKEALSHLARGRFDGVLLDLNLPDSSGVASLKQVTARFPHVPLVVYAGAPHGVAWRDAAHAASVMDVVGKNGRASLEIPGSVEAMIQLSALRQEPDPLLGLLEDTIEAVLVAGHDGEVFFVNDAACSLLGQTREQLLGHNLGFSVAPGRSTELEILNAREPVRVELRVAACGWRDGPASIALINRKPVGTEAKHAEDAA